MLDGDMFLWGIFTIRSNINGLGLRSNTIKNLCPLIFYQLVVGWIGKAHGPTSGIGSSCWSRIVREGLWGIFTICSNTNGLGLRSNAIKDLCPLILHQLVIGWIGKAHGPTVLLVCVCVYPVLGQLLDLCWQKRWEVKTCRNLILFWSDVKHI